MTKIFQDVAAKTYREVRASYREEDEAIISTPPANMQLPIAGTPELRQAIAETPVQLLIAVKAHLTGDLSILDRAQPYIKSLWEGGVQMPPEIEQDFRKETLKLLQEGPAQTPRPLTAAELKRIMTVIVGEPVGDEFLPLLIEQSGFTPAGPFVPKAHRKPPAGYSVGVIGAGLSGIAAGVKLAEHDYEYKIFERDTEVGGVWWNNKYPGVGVDTPSHFYSYSFDLNPDWPRFYSNGAVLMEYWKKIAQKYNIYEHISFRTTVTDIIWEESEKLWLLRYVKADGSKGEQKFNAIFCAAGLFTNPEPPPIPGFDTFKGKTVHTAQWDTSLDLTDKRVAMIGTGASGLQVGPSIAPKVEHLTIFQRTPPWVMVRPERDNNQEVPEGFRWALGHIPFLGQWMRFYTYWGASDGTHKLVVRDPNWPDSDTSVNAASEQWREMLTMLLAKKMQDRPDLLAKMTPNYPVMGVRLLRDSSWCDTLKRNNVVLETSPITCIDESGLHTEDGHYYPVDVLILATGFKMTKILHHINIQGHNGTKLKDVWANEDLRSYKASLVPSFPNFFFAVGPNGGATHGSGINLYVEAQINYMLAALDEVFAHQATTIEVTKEAHDAYNRELDEALPQTVWNHRNVASYYLNSQRRNFISSPWRIVDFWQMLRSPDLKDMKID